MWENSTRARFFLKKLFLASLQNTKVVLLVYMYYSVLSLWGGICCSLIKFLYRVGSLFYFFIDGISLCGDSFNHVRLFSFSNMVSICRRSLNKVFSCLKVESRFKPSKNSGPLVVLDGYRPPVVPVARPPSFGRPRVLEAEGGRGHDLGLVAVALEALLVADYLGNGKYFKISTLFHVEGEGNSSSSFGEFPCPNQGEEREEDHIYINCGDNPNIFLGV